MQKINHRTKILPYENLLNKLENSLKCGKTEKSCILGEMPTVLPVLQQPQAPVTIARSLKLYLKIMIRFSKSTFIHETSYYTTMLNWQTG